MKEIIAELPKLAKEKHTENKNYFAKLKRKRIKKLDLIVQEIHHKEFTTTDCLSCANCCKTTSPIITNRDINKISKFLRIKEVDFIKQYLIRDADDGLYMLNKTPCPFLDLSDNKCFIYEVRPKACSEYPHTDRKRFTQITNITLKNTEICPAVFNIVEKMKEKLPV